MLVAKHQLSRWSLKIDRNQIRTDATRHRIYITYPKLQRIHLKHCPFTVLKFKGCDTKKDKWIHKNDEFDEFSINPKKKIFWQSKPEWLLSKSTTFVTHSQALFLSNFADRGLRNNRRKACISMVSKQQVWNVPKHYFSIQPLSVRRLQKRPSGEFWLWFRRRARAPLLLTWPVIRLDFDLSCSSLIREKFTCHDHAESLSWRLSAEAAAIPNPR